MSIVERERVMGGRYRIVDVLGDGGMARVYKAVDERLGRVVAVKVLHDYYNGQSTFVGRFEQEAKLAAGLNHPNIMAVYDTGHDDGGDHYIIVEYVEGETLKRLIEREAPLALPAAVAILRQICLALDYAHARGVVHRDVKPENIFLTPDHTVKVGDFGIARALDASTLTPAGMVLGSVSYFAPEQAMGQRSTAQSDLYATGVALYELLTGRLPFVAENALGVAMMHLNEEPAPPSRYNPALPPAVDAVVLAALAKDPARRYRNGAAFVDALARAAQATGAVAPITPPALVAPAPLAPEATTPLPAALITAATTTRLLNMGPPGTSRVGATPVTTTSIVDANGAFTTHRLDDGTWTAISGAHGRTPLGAPPSVAVSPARVGLTTRRWRALIPLIVPLLAVLAIAGAIKAITGVHGQNERYGAGYTGTPTTTATSVRTRAITRKGRALIVPAVALSATPMPTPRRAVPARRHYAQRERPRRAYRSPTPTTSPRGSAGDSGGASTAGTYSYTTATATPESAYVPATVAPTVPPVVARPSSTDAPAYTPPRAAPARTPRPPATATYLAPLATATYLAPLATATYLAPLATNTPVPAATDTPILADTSTSTAVPRDVSTPTGAAGDAAPTNAPTNAPTVNTPEAAATVIPTAVPTTTGDQGVPSSLNLNNVAASSQALAAVYHANDVYMQVMNGPDASAVDTAYGSYLANQNRSVAASLQANHQHWRISLVGAIGLSNAQVIDANTVRVTVTKTEDAELLSDAGQIVKRSYRDTETFVDIVQRVDGNWLVTQVYHH